jgi:putative hydrolase of the HAD superfamily
MTIRAILFDAGDTLFRVRGSVGEVYATVAARHGVSAAVPEIEQRFRATFRRMPPLAFPDAPEAELPRCEYSWWRAVVAAVFSDHRFADFDAFFTDLFAYFARSESWELFPDTEPALAALRARGLRLGIVSNFDGRLTGICQGLGIADYFEAIVMSARAGSAKPDQRIFSVALRRMGVGPSDAIHVGDSESEDVNGAHAAGLRAILVRRTSPVGSAQDRVGDLREIVDRC